jgi:hypothetical protein
MKFFNLEVNLENSPEEGFSFSSSLSRISSKDLSFRLSGSASPKKALALFS